MAKQIHIEVTESQDDLKAIIKGLNDYNFDQLKYNDTESFNVVVKNENSEIIGGLICRTYWEWVELNVLWVKPEYRNQGIATQLMNMLEKEAEKRKCKGIFLDTFSFQEPQFYLNQGFHIFGELEHFPNGHKRFYLKKHLD